jgi:L-serine kinase (ATP) / ParB family transcriptional regulator, heme-responsive regulator
MDLTQLKIVPLKNLIPHELADFKRIEFLSKRIVRDGHLKNPIVAGRQRDGNRFLILDGTTRASALKVLNFPDALVQVVDFESPEVKLDTWKHLILGTNRDEIEEEARRLNLNVTLTGRDEALSVLRDKKVVSCFLFDEENNLVISNGGSDLETQVRELKKLLSVCYKKPRIYCTDDAESSNLAKQAHNGRAVTHLLPAFGKEEIRSMALRGILLPMGITRFVIPQRILRVDVSNEVLASNVSLEEKNLFLSELIRYRLENKKIRLYQEPVVFLNE